jgi:secernin
MLPKSPDDLPIFWWAAGPPCNACYVPFFVHGSGLPAVMSAAGTLGKRVAPPVEVAEDQYASGSFWWLFRKLMDCVKGDALQSLPGLYPVRNQLVRERFGALEAEFEVSLPGAIQRACAAKRGSIDAAVLDEFMADCVARVVSEVQDLISLFGE